MKQSDNIHDEEQKLVDTIKRMSNQVRVAGLNSMAAEHSEFLSEVIEHLENQLESMRKNRQLGNPA